MWIVGKYLRKVKNIKRPPAKIKQLAGTTVTIAGFMVPLDGNKDGIREFLLVPAQGQCIHLPPPPPNQMVYVRMTKKGLEHSWEPVIVKGKFLIKKMKNQFGKSFFSMKATGVTAYAR